MLSERKTISVLECLKLPIQSIAPAFTKSPWFPVSKTSRKGHGPSDNGLILNMHKYTHTNWHLGKREDKTKQKQSSKI